MEPVTLEKSISIHPWNGWGDDGRPVGDTNTCQRLVEWGAKYVRDNSTKKVYLIRRDIKSKPFDLEPVEVKWVSMVTR